MNLLTTKQTAERLGVTVARIHAMIRDERLPASKFGRDYVIQEDDLKLVENRKAGRPPKMNTEATSSSSTKPVRLPRQPLCARALEPGAKKSEKK